MVEKIFYSHPGKELVQLLFQLCYICPIAIKNSSEWSFKEAEHLVWLLQNSKVYIILNIITLILPIFCSILHFDHKWNIHRLETEIYKIKSELLTAMNIKNVFLWDMILVPMYQMTRCHIPNNRNINTQNL